MNNKILIILVAVIAIIFISGCVQEPAKEEEIEKTEEIITSAETEDIIEIGVSAMLSPKETLYAYEDIVEYIGKGLGKETRMVYVKNYAAMNDMIKNKEVDAAFVCSGPYVSGHDEWGMELISAPQMYGETVYYSYIIVPIDSEIKTLKELKEKNFAFTDPKSNTGKLVPTYELAKMNETPDSFFKTYIFTGSHDESIEAVADKIVDGAAVDHLIWEYINEKNPIYTSKTKVIEKLGPFCIPPFVVPPDTDAKTKAKMRAILLDMHNDPKGKTILDEIHIDKFVVVQDDCYDSIREMEKWVKSMEED